MLLQLLDNSLLAVPGDLLGPAADLGPRGCSSSRLLDSLQFDGLVVLLLEKLWIILRRRELATAERDSRYSGVLQRLLHVALSISTLSYKRHLWLHSLSLLARLLFR